MSRYIVNTGMQEIQMEAATGSQVEKETQESRWSDESYSDKDVGPVVPVKTYREHESDLDDITFNITLCIRIRDLQSQKERLIYGQN